ncbi:MAG: His/Gly/Thr/Pro-type tRNA ligase C-terminal domain-containing protein [Chlamydiota bacterium]
MTNKHIFISDLRRAAAALLALAVKELFPQVTLGESGATSLGFYCDFFSDFPFTPPILQKIEERMDQSIWEKKELLFREMTPFSAKEYFLFRKEPWLAKLAEAGTGSTVSLVDIAGKMFFIEDSSKMKHLGEIGAIKIYKSEVLEGFQKRIRVHGVAFFDKQERKEFLKTSSDQIGVSHVNLGLEKKLFEEVKEGKWVWFPKGQKIRSLLNLKLHGLFEEYGFLPVSTTPVMESFSRKKIFIQHKEIFEKEEPSERRFAISECVTICESEDKIFSSGLLDSSVFQINISHLFCKKELLLGEVISYLHFMTKIFKILDFVAQIALIGKPKLGESAVLVEALSHLGVEFSQETDGNEVFRIEWRVRDRMGMLWPVSCLYAPQKLIAQGGCFCLSASLFLSLERMVALLIENKGGKIPVWLAPSQVSIIPVQESHLEYAEEVALELRNRGIRVGVEKGNGELKARLRQAFSEEIPFVIAVGDKEAENKKVTLRGVGVEPKSLSLEELIEMLKQ